MATKVHAKREHGMSLEDAMETAEAIARRAQDKAGVSYRVVDSRIEVEGKGVSGVITVDATHVEVLLELGLVLRPMKGLIERKMAEYFDRYLDKRGA